MSEVTNRDPWDWKVIGKRRRTTAFKYALRVKKNQLHCQFRFCAHIKPVVVYLLRETEEGKKSYSLDDILQMLVFVCSLHDTSHTSKLIFASELFTELKQHFRFRNPFLSFSQLLW